MTVISFTDQGKRKIVAYANDQNAIERVESSYGHPVVGDMKVVTNYGPYRDFAGVKFPTRIVQYQDGLPALDVIVTAVQRQSDFQCRSAGQCAHHTDDGEVRKNRGRRLVYRRRLA